jgi:glycosyltransferase involved in cell wall biosynthesis
MNKTIFLETHNIKNRATGLGTFNYELIKGFSKIDLEGFDLIFNSKKPSELEAEFGTIFKYHQYKSLSRYAIFQNRNKYDLWHSVNQNTKIEPSNPKNYLLTIHDVNFVEEDSIELRRKNKALFIAKLERATAITYISAFAKKQTHDLFHLPNVPEFIIHNGNPISNLADLTDFKTNFSIEKPFFYSIGDFIPRKNFESIVNMMVHIQDYNLIISGDYNKPYGKEIENLIAKKKLQNRVFLTGKVADKSKQYYMTNCVAFLFPSIREGFGLPPIEAMTFGKPIFLANKTSLPEIGGQDCYYWDNFESDYMTKILVEGLQHFENNKEKMESLMKIRAASFDWKIAANQYLEVYKKLLY